MQPEVKLCKNCKYYFIEGESPCGLKIPQCRVSTQWNIDFVEGKHKSERNYCINQRKPSSKCKPRGIFFEQKVSFWDKLKNVFKLN
jgi:hypothetical protein